MEIKRIAAGKKDYLPLLLLADESEAMIDNYLARGDLFVLDDGGVKAACVVTREAEGVYELKNIAVLPAHQRKGYGARLMRFLLTQYPDCRRMLVGTGDSAAIAPHRR